MSTQDQPKQPVNSEAAFPDEAPADVSPADEPTAVVVPPTSPQEQANQHVAGVPSSGDGSSPPPGDGWGPAVMATPPTKASARERFAKSPKLVLATAVLFTAVASSGLTAGIMSAAGGNGGSPTGVTVQQGGPGGSMRGGGGGFGGQGQGQGPGQGQAPGQGQGPGQGQSDTTDQGTADQGTADQGTTDQDATDQGTTGQGATDQSTGT
jgi:hypothetical protein